MTRRLQRSSLIQIETVDTTDGDIHDDILNHQHRGTVVHTRMRSEVGGSRLDSQTRSRVKWVRPGSCRGSEESQGSARAGFPQVNDDSVKTSRVRLELETPAISSAIHPQPQAVGIGHALTLTEASSKGSDQGQTGSLTGSDSVKHTSDIVTESLTEHYVHGLRASFRASSDQHS